MASGGAPLHRVKGNTLILNEVRKLLDEGRTVGDKELSEYMEVLGYGNAARWVYGQALEPGDWTTGHLLSIQEVRTVHYEAMTPVWNVAPHPYATPSETPGNWRRHDIAPFPDGMTPPPFPDVDHRMTDWVADVNKLRGDDDLAFPERLAKTHNDFEKIHPYLDGNGRAGRLLLNLLLVRLGYPPAIVFKNERTKYLNAIARRTRATTARSASCSPARSPTTSTSSLCLQLPARPALCRWPAWLTRRRA